jgi:hypothetical protein
MNPKIWGSNKLSRAKVAVTLKKRLPRPLMLFYVVTSLFLAGVFLSGGMRVSQPAPSSIKGGGVHGSVFVAAAPRSPELLVLNSRTKTEALLLPDFEVSLVNLGTNTASASVKTDLFGVITSHAKNRVSMMCVGKNKTVGLQVG